MTLIERAVTLRGMRSILPRHAALALLALIFLGARPVSGRIHLVVLHTNDVHGQAQPRAATWIDRDQPPEIGGLPRLAAFVRAVRAEEQNVLVVDGGDWSQGTPEGLLDHGQAFLAAMAHVGYDAMAVGNHELDHGVEVLRDSLSELGLPAVCANVRVQEGGARVDWVEPWRVVEVGGLRVGLVGLLSTTTPSITHADAKALHFDTPAVALREAARELEGEVDWLLPLTHIGVLEDRRLAKAAPELDLIVGGHSHTYLAEGIEQGETFIVQAGSKASAVGRVDLWFEGEERELVERTYTLVDLLEEPGPQVRNEVVDGLCAELVERSEAHMASEVGRLTAPLVRGFDRVVSASAGNFVADAMRARMRSDVAIMNRGGLRSDLMAGPVTRRGLFELSPFGNHLVEFEVDGATLEALLARAVEGVAHTGLEVSGIEVRYHRAEDGRPRLDELWIDGARVEDEGRYTLATNSFLAGGGDGYEELASLEPLREDPALLREVTEACFIAQGEVTPEGENRFVEVER